MKIRTLCALPTIIAVSALFASNGAIAEDFGPVETPTQTCKMNPELCDFSPDTTSRDGDTTARPLSKKEEKAFGILGDCLFGGDCSRMNDPL